MSQLLNYKSFVKKLDIRKEDIILINSNFLNIFLRARVQKKQINFDKLISEILLRIGPKGTLLIPAYSWEFCKTKFFNFDKSKSICGSLSNYFIEKNIFKRTNNPVYSFLVKGFYQNYLCSLKNKDSFGKNSIFNFLIKKNSKNIFFDIDYKDSFTFVHLIEQEAKVNYRFKKTFSGTCYKNGKINKVSTVVYSRKLETGVKGTKIDDKFDKILKKNEAIIKKKIMNVNCQIIDISKTCKIMKKLFINGKNKYIYPIYKK